MVASRWWILAVAEPLAMWIVFTRFLGIELSDLRTNDTRLLVAMIILSFVGVAACVFPKLRPWRPGAYVTVGLAATFIGIALTLSTLRLPSGEEQSAMIATEFTDFLHTAGLAFRASALGVCLSVVATFFNRLFLESDDDQLFRMAAAALIHTQQETADYLRAAGDAAANAARDQLATLMATTGAQFSRAAADAGASLQHNLEASAAALNSAIGVASTRLAECAARAADTFIQADSAMRQGSDGMVELVSRIGKLAGPIEAMTESQRGANVEIERASRLLGSVVASLKEAAKQQEAAVGSIGGLTTSQATIMKSLGASTAAVVEIGASLQAIQKRFDPLFLQLSGLLQVSSDYAARLGTAAESLAALEHLDSRLGPPLERLVGQIEGQMGKILATTNSELAEISKHANSRMRDLESDLFGSAVTVAAASSSHLERIDGHLTKMDALFSTMTQAASAMAASTDALRFAVLTNIRAQEPASRAPPADPDRTSAAQEVP